MNRSARTQRLDIRVSGFPMLLLVTACLSRPAPCAAQQPPTGLDGVTVRAELVPPGPVSDRTMVQLRLAVQNRGRADREARITVSLDGGNAPPAIHQQAVNVPGDGSRLAQVWLSTEGHSGRRAVRWLVESPGVSTCEGANDLLVISSPTPALPILQAGWIDPLGLLDSIYPRDMPAGETDLRAILDAMNGLGMTVVMITYVEYQGRFFYPSRLSFHDRDMQKQAEGEWFDYDFVGTVLSQADHNGMRVFLGLGRGGDTDLLWGGLGDRERLRQAARLSADVARELWEFYGHHESLYGWYLTHEANDLARAGVYYNAVADFCHSLAPEKPVMIAPAGTPIADRSIIAASHVDIFAYQDAVGAGYVPCVYTYDPDRRIAELEDIFSRYRDWHQASGKHLWADVELWEMAGPEYEKPYAASFERLMRQIRAAAPYVDMLTGYEVTGFLQPGNTPSRLLDPRSAALFSGYESYCREFWRLLPGRTRGEPGGQDRSQDGR